MKVKFLPQDIEVEIKPNESVLSVAQDHGIHIQSVCKGIPSCAECRVNIKEGETNVIPPLQPELELIGTSYYIDQRRLSCQLRCFGDVVIDLNSQIEKQERSAKNPQGRYVKEREDSHARMGSVLEELGEESDFEKTEEDLKAEAEETKKNARSNNSRSRQQRGEGSAKTKPQNHKDGGQKKRNNKNRNRNRRRNKNKSDSSNKTHSDSKK